MYTKRKEMPKFIWSSPRIFGYKPPTVCQTMGGFIFYSLSFFFRKESNAITVLATVAKQVTTAITNSKVIDKPP